MRTFVEKESPETLKYNRYIFGEFLKRAPFSKKESVELKIIENLTPFPKITEIADEFPEKDFFVKEVVDWEPRQRARFDAILQYTDDLLSPMCVQAHPVVENDMQMDLILYYLVVDPEAIYKKAKEVCYLSENSVKNDNDVEKLEKEETKTVLHLNNTGDLWRNPKNIYCYPVKTGSDRHKILDFLVNNPRYQMPALISTECNIKDAQTVRNTIGAMNKTANRFLKLDGENIIESKIGSGYKINSKFKIIRH